MSYFSEAGQTTELKMMTSARSWDKSLRVTGEPLRSARTKSMRVSPILNETSSAPVWRGAAQRRSGRVRKRKVEMVIRR